MASNSFEVKGLRELDAQLARLSATTQAKILRNSIRAAMKPALERARQDAPVGTEGHKTHKGRLVPPGFAKRNLRVVTYVDRRKPGVAGAVMGARKEAFYAIQFWEFPPLAYGITNRRKWFSKAFEAVTDDLVDVFREQVSDRIKKAVKA